MGARVHQGHWALLTGCGGWMQQGGDHGCEASFCAQITPQGCDHEDGSRNDEKGQDPARDLWEEASPGRDCAAALCFLTATLSPQIILWPALSGGALPVPSGTLWFAVCLPVCCVPPLSTVSGPGRLNNVETLLTLFRQLDVNGDGEVSWDDVSSNILEARPGCLMRTGWACHEVAASHAHLE